MKIVHAVLFLACAANFAGAQKATPKPEPKKYSCVAGPNEQCASDLWFADYQRLKALQEKYSAPPDVRDLMVGIATRLNQQIPTGYRWDEAKTRFIKIEEPKAETKKEPEAKK